MPYSRPPLTKDLLRGESAEADLPLEEEAWLDEQRRGPHHRTGRGTGRRRPSGAAVRRDASCAYVSCLLATGAEPTRLPVPGGDRPWVHVVRTVEHVRDRSRRAWTMATESW